MEISLNPDSPALPAFPDRLREALENKVSPWHEVLLQSAPSSSSNGSFDCTVTNLEFAMVQDYFNHFHPQGKQIIGIKRRFHDASSQDFDNEVRRLEDLNDLASGASEPLSPAQQEVKRRYEALACVFPSFQIRVNGRGKKLTQVRVFLLWQSPHASKTLNAHHFTNSARCAASDGSNRLVLSWVAMRDPYPVVAPFRFDKARSHLNQNACYAPLASINGQNYSPCTANQSPVYDQFTVLDKAQVLDQYDVELGDTLPPELSLNATERAFHACQTGDLAFLQEWSAGEAANLQLRGPYGESWLKQQQSSLLDLRTPFGGSLLPRRAPTSNLAQPPTFEENYIKTAHLRLLTKLKDLDEQFFSALDTIMGHSKLRKILQSKAENASIALHIAAQEGKLDACQLLVRAGINRWAVDQAGLTALDLAIRKNHDEIGRYLIDPNNFSPSETPEKPDQEDLDGFYYKALEEAYYTSRIADQLFYLEKRAHLNLVKNDYQKAAHLLNAAHRMAVLNNFDEAYQNRLLAKLENLEERFLFETMDIFKVPASHHGSIARYRKRLTEIRDVLKEELIEREKIDELLCINFMSYVQLLSQGLPEYTDKLKTIKFTREELHEFMLILALPIFLETKRLISEGKQAEINELNRIQLEQKKLGTQRKTMFSIQTGLTQKIQAVLVEMIQDSIELLGKPNTPFAVLALGSMGRGEISPYSDWEFAFLINDPNKKDYFRRLAKILELKILNLGETYYLIIAGRTIDGQKHLPISITPKGVSMDRILSPLDNGMHELIDTPEKLAEIYTSDWIKQHGGDIVVVNAMTAASRLMGDPELFVRYDSSVNRILSRKEDAWVGSIGGTEYRQTLAIQLLKENIKDFKHDLTEKKIKDRDFDIKTEFYKPIQMIISSLALYYNLPSKNTFTRIKELKLEKLEDTLSSAIALRMKLQLLNGEECETMAHPSEVAKHHFVIESNETLIIANIYRVLIPLHQAAIAFVNGDRGAFRRRLFLLDLFRAPRDFEKGSKHHFVEEMRAHLLNDGQPKLARLIRIAALNPSDFFTRIKINYIKLNSQLTDKQSALECAKSLFAEITHLHPNTHTSEKILAALEVMRIYCEMDNKEALYYFQKAEELVYKLLFDDSDVPELHLFEWCKVFALASKILGAPSRTLRYQLLAVEIMRRIHKGKPNSSIEHALRELGQTCLLMGDQRAQEYCDWFSSRCPEAHWRMGLAQYVGFELNDMKNLFQSSVQVVRGFGNPIFAITLLDDLLRIQRIGYENKPHRQIIYTLIDLGKAHKAQAQYQEAIEFYKQALGMEKQLDGFSKDIVNLNRKLASLYEKLGDETNAAAYLKEAYLEALKEADAAAYLEEAYLETLKEVIDSRELLMQENLFDIIKSHACLMLYYNRFSSSLDSFHELLRLQKHFYKNEPSADLAQTLAYVGKVHEAQTQYQEAITFYKQALDMRKQLNDGSNQDIVALWNKLGRLYEKVGDAESANACWETSIAMSLSTCHQDIEFLLQGIGSAET